VLERVRGARQLRARRRIGEWGPTTTNNSRRTTPAVKPRPKVNPSPRTNRVPTNTQFLSYQMTDNFTSGQTQPPVHSSFHSQSMPSTKLLQISQHADYPLTISGSKITHYHGSPLFFLPPTRSDLLSSRQYFAIITAIPTFSLRLLRFSLPQVTYSWP